MNLPHQAPIRFVENIIEKNNDYFIVNCTFPHIPTLPMVCEAAAQSSASYAQESKEVQVGFLISLKNVKIVSEFTKNKYKIKIQKTFNFDKMTEYRFELFDELNVYAIGELTIALQK